MLNRLERADRLTELLAYLGVLDAHVHTASGGAEHFGGRADRGPLEDAAQNAPTCIELANDRIRGYSNVVQYHRGGARGSVHLHVLLFAESGSVAGNGKQRESAGCGSGYEDQVRNMRIGHETLFA